MKNINNVFGSSEVYKNNNTQKMRVDGVKQPVGFLFFGCNFSSWIHQYKKSEGEIFLLKNNNKLRKGRYLKSFHKDIMKVAFLYVFYFYYFLLYIQNFKNL